MNFQISGHSSRGTRMHQPSVRETRKQRRKPPPTIRMPDGRHITAVAFTELCERSKDLLGSRARGCAAYLSSFVPAREWKPITKWISQQQSRLGGIGAHASEDELVAMLVCHAASHKQNPADVLADIVRGQTVAPFFTNN